MSLVLYLHHNHVAVKNSDGRMGKCKNYVEGLPSRRSSKETIKDIRSLQTCGMEGNEVSVLTLMPTNGVAIRDEWFGEVSSKK